MSAATCEFCGKPATCYGSYEGAAAAYACDDCCGHGQDDGRCSPVDSLATLSARVVEAAVAEARYHGESRLRGCACDICAAADAYLAALEGR